MSTASASESPRWAWFAHHQMQFIIVAISVAVASDLIELLGFDIAGRVLSVIGTACLIGFCVSLSAGRRHLGMLCARCLDSVPTDAAVQVRRRDWALRLRHWTWAHPWLTLTPILALFVVSLFVPTAWVAVYVLWPWFALDTWTQRFHNRVGPWCPYCRGGGGGSGETVALPDPVPTGRKVV